MNLLQIRQKFRELSGLYELVNEDGSDNGADFFINEGRKFLDRLDETQKSWASCFRVIDIGHFSTSFPHCRAIKEVWATDSISGRTQLEKRSLQDIVSNYMANLPSKRNMGIPIYYSPCITRYIPEGANISEIESFIGYVDVPAGNSHEYNSIILNIPVKNKTLIEVKGLFYSNELVNDTDENYWSVSHPMLLIMAAMRQVEIVNRNTQGVRDWTESILTEVRQLGMDLVEELIAEVDQMEG